jgi:DNA-directed RNA polymerase specialized sigma24 family protein
MNFPISSSDSSAELLAQISTIWSNVLKAHGGPDRADALEQSRFFDRYHPAIVRYLMSCLHDEDAAADLFQEFALRFVRGDFAKVRPRTGSFRQYVKTALINLERF